MKLQTTIPLKKGQNRIDYHSRVLVLGSCFAENIGDKLAYFQFQSQKNLLGILFHPLAIEAFIVKAIRGEAYTEADIFFLNDRWNCFDIHSNLSHTSKSLFLQIVNSRLQETRALLAKATHLCITLGTSWVYRHQATGAIVANCHKVPQKEFRKEVLNVDTIAQSLHRMLATVQSINKSAHVIFTISPVRHIKDGFVENQQSKAHLITALHQTLAQPAVQQYASYFPSYEIMMDELRDYRFYAEDMVHPNTTGINYIWERFSDVWVAPKALPIMEQVGAIQKDLQHKPFNALSQQHQDFLQSLSQKISYLKGQYPFMDFNLKY